MAIAIVLRLQGGVIKENNMEWANALIWNIGTAKGFEQLSLTAKVDFELVAQFPESRFPFPAFCQIDFEPTKIKDRNGKEVAGIIITEIEYIKPLHHKDLLSLMTAENKIIHEPASPEKEQARAETVAAMVGQPESGANVSEPAKKSAGSGIFGR
jgi:hypothetical protein